MDVGLNSQQYQLLGRTRLANIAPSQLAIRPNGPRAASTCDKHVSHQMAGPSIALRIMNDDHPDGGRMYGAALPVDAENWLSALRVMSQQWAFAANHVTRRLQGIINQTDGRISCPRYPTYPFTAIGQLAYQAESTHQEFVCTGALVGPDVVLTAAHCVYNREARAFSKGLTFSPGRFVTSQGTVLNPFGELSWTQVDIMQEYVQDLKADPNPMDIAVITLTRPIGLTTGWLGLAPACGAGWNETFLASTAGYPVDKACGSCVAAQCSITQHDCRSDPFLFYSCATKWGQSGSPILHTQVGRNGTWAHYIRAVHTIQPNMSCQHSGLSAHHPSKHGRDPIFFILFTLSAPKK